jgi:hypothetical protein
MTQQQQQARTHLRSPLISSAPAIHASSSTFPHPYILPASSYHNTAHHDQPHRRGHTSAKHRRPRQPRRRFRRPRRLPGRRSNRPATHHPEVSRARSRRWLLSGLQTPVATQARISTLRHDCTLLYKLEQWPDALAQFFDHRIKSFRLVRPHDQIFEDLAGGENMDNFISPHLPFVIWRHKTQVFVSLLPS